MGKRSDWKKASQIGPGGMKCVCCGPAPGKDKTREKRVWKRREKHQANLQIRMEASDE